MLVLDTRTLPARDRAEAFQTAISGNASTSLAVFEDPSDVSAVLHTFELGPGRVFNVEASGNTLRRTPRIARRQANDAIALAVPLTGRNRLRRDRSYDVLGAGDLLLVDLDAPYEYGWSGAGSSYAFQVSRDRLDLPADLIVKAAVQLRASPLYPLVRDHIRHITIEAELLERHAAASEIGAVTVDLMRALIATAAGSPLDAETVLLPRMLDYVRRNLADPELSPARIAAEHHVSLRYLYKLFAQRNMSIEDWLVGCRLAAARAALASPYGRRHTIAAVARGCGFVNHSFFSARFRRAYGMTPRQWRDRSVTGV